PARTVVHRNVGPRGADGHPPVLRPGDAGPERWRFLDDLPRLAAVGGDRTGGFRAVRFAVIATDDHAVVAIPEGDRERAGRLDPEGDGVEDRSGFGVLDLKPPGPAAVRRLVAPGLFAGADAQQVSRVLAEPLDVAEVEFVRVGHRADGPRLPAVGGAAEGSP